MLGHFQTPIRRGGQALEQLVILAVSLQIGEDALPQAFTKAGSLTCLKHGEEHLATRRACGLFDVSHMGRLRFDGPGAAALLDRLLTRTVVGMEPGKIRYSLVCNERGGILDDVLVYHLQEHGGGLYLMIIDNLELHDVDIFDISNPATPVPVHLLVGLLDLREQLGPVGERFCRGVVLQP